MPCFSEQEEDVRVREVFERVEQAHEGEQAGDEPRERDPDRQPSGSPIGGAAHAAQRHESVEKRAREHATGVVEDAVTTQDGDDAWRIRRRTELKEHEEEREYDAR